MFPLFAFSKEFSVSGFSSGAFMASQIHIAYSKDVIGAGIVGGAPYYCALNLPIYAKFACTTMPYLIDVDILKFYADNQSDLGNIDNVQNLKDDKVWIFGGRNDTMISYGAGIKVKEFYEKYMPKDNIISYFDIVAAHGFITDIYGNECGKYGFPYMNNCGLDAAGEILNHIYGKLLPKVKQIDENLVQFDQSHFIAKNSGIFKTGYKYIPTNCENKGCRVHVALHGCGMSWEYIGNAFIYNAGYNEWAEANDIVIIYPQAERHTDYNPHACWDGWGVSGSDYALKSGLQPNSIYKMAQAS